MAKETYNAKLASSPIMNISMDPNPKSFLIYMKALAYRRLGENDEASKLYMQLVKRNKREENDKLWSTMFSILLLP
jgi:hypothetical protein